MTGFRSIPVPWRPGLVDKLPGCLYPVGVPRARSLHVLSVPRGTLHHGPIYTVYIGPCIVIVQEQCESRGGRPGLSVLTSLLVSVDEKLF